MNVYVKIPIKYRDDPIDPDVKSTVFEFKQNNADQAYQQGQLIADVMDKIADFLDKLPNTAMIIQMSNTDMLHKKQEIINYLRRHDDQLSVTIFNENTVTQSNEGAPKTQPSKLDNKQEKEEKMSENKENESVESENTTAQNEQVSEQNAQKADETGFHRNYPLFVHVQKQGKHSYDPYDLNHQVPDDNDYINAIGMSHIKRCRWKDIKSILKDNIDLIFKNPLGILPVNGSLTDNRRKTIAQNSGLETDKVKDVEFKNLGILESNADGTHQIIGKLVVLILKPITPEPKTQNQKENEKKQALVDSETDDVKQAIADADAKDEAEQASRPQEKEKEQPTKMNNDLGNDIFKTFVPEGTNANQVTSSNTQQANNTFSNAQSNTSKSQNPFDAMEQSNTQTFPNSSSSTNNSLTTEAINKATSDIIARIDDLKNDLATYQKTADRAFTLAAVANDVDTSNLPVQFISWARTQVKDDATRANAIFMITKEIQKQNPAGFCQELRDPSKYVRAVEYLSKETL